MPISTSKQSNSSDKKWRVTSLVIILLLAAGALFVAFPPQDKINQGLDIQGGLSVVLSAESTDGEPVSQESMEKSKAIIEERVNALGASEASVQIQGGDQILVQIPGMSDSQEALNTIGRTGVLEFARLDSFTDEDVRNKIDTGDIYETTSSTNTYVSEGGTSYPLGETKRENMSVEAGTYTPMFTGDHITNVTVGKAGEASADYAVNVTLDSEAAAEFATASKDLLPTNGKIVIIIDGKVNSAPAVQSEILNGQVQITGNYSLAEAKSLQTVLDSGSLPVSFHYEQSTTVGPTLGQGELQAGVIAMLLGLLIVMLYLIFFYKGFGLITTANMVIFACIYLGVLASLSAIGAFSLSLAGIAGIILSIGMAADSSILVIERFKEEIKEGRSMKAASISGVKHAITTSIDADIVSIISALSLFFLASSTVKGFGLTLALGIICDILVMLMFKAPIVRLLAPNVMHKHPGFWGVKYSLELGDIRTGGHNYMTPEEIKEIEAERREKEAEEKAKKKAAKESKKKHDKEVAEMQKERERKAKLAEKEKAAAAKAAKKEKEKEETVESADDEEKDVEIQDETTDKVEEVEIDKESDDSEVDEEVASEDEGTDEMEAEVPEPEPDEIEPDQDNEASESEESEPGPEPEPESESEPEPEDEVIEEIEANHSGIKEHTAEEIAKILANSDKFIPAPKKETVEGDQQFSYTSPADDDIGKIDAAEIAAVQSGRPVETVKNEKQDEQPRMNRAQRRAMEKANRSKKNKKN